MFLTSSNLALYTSHCWAMLLAPLASSFWAYSATFSSISRSFLRLLSSISVARGVSEEGVACSSGLFGESSLTGGLTNAWKERKFFTFSITKRKFERLFYTYMKSITQAGTKKLRRLKRVANITQVFNMLLDSSNVFFLHSAGTGRSKWRLFLILREIPRSFRRLSENGTSTHERNEVTTSVKFWLEMALVYWVNAATRFKFLRITMKYLLWRRLTLFNSLPVRPIPFWRNVRNIWSKKEQKKWKLS